MGMTLQELMELAESKGLQLLVRTGSDGLYFVHLFKKDAAGEYPETVYREHSEELRPLLIRLIDEVTGYGDPVVEFPDEANRESSVRLTVSEAHILCGIIVATPCTCAKDAYLKSVYADPIVDQERVTKAVVSVYEKLRKAI